MSEYILNKYKNNVLIVKDDIGQTKNVGYQVSRDKVFGKPSSQKLQHSARDGKFKFFDLSSFSLATAGEEWKE